MQIMDGAVLFNVEFEIPRYYQFVSVELRIENDFLQSGFNYIKSYLGKCLNRKTVEVMAIIRTQGREVVSVEAEAPLIDEINSSLLEDVKYQFIRRELRNAGEDSNVVTVEDLFEEVKDSGLKPDDRQFVEDLLKVKEPKHADTIRYLSSLDLYDVMKLRMLKKPFAFLFLVSGRKGCFLVLETLNSQDATYLWKLNSTEEELRDNPRLVGQEFEWVEQEVTIISDEGRDPYKKDAHKNFHLVRHEYEKEDGFTTWKMRLHQVLDGDGAD